MSGSLHSGLGGYVSSVTSHFPSGHEALIRTVTSGPSKAHGTHPASDVHLFSECNSFLTHPYSAVTVALCWGRGKWLITSDRGCRGNGGRSTAGWHIRGRWGVTYRASVVRFGRQLLNTVRAQVLKKSWAFPMEEDLPATAMYGGPAPRGPRDCGQVGGAPV